MPNAAQRREAIFEHVRDAARISNRSPDAIRIVAVSKGRSAQEIEEIIAAGHRDFGENRVQEAQEKWPSILNRHPDVKLHFIGRLQSNKAAEAVELFDSIHSVDRPSLVEALARQDSPPTLFVQVNIGDEAQKGGCAIADLPALLAEVASAGLKPVGLMAVPPLGVEPAPYFALLAKLADRHGLDRLSMGMSSDYRDAVMLGATDLRIGTAFFEDQ